MLFATEIASQYHLHLLREFLLVFLMTILHISDDKKPKTDVIVLVTLEGL